MRYITYLIIVFVALFSRSGLAAEFNMIHMFGASADAIAIGKIKGNSDHSSAVFGNPAALFRIKKRSLSAFNATIMSDWVHYQSLSFAKTLGRHRLALGRYTAQVSNIPQVSDFIIQGHDTYRNAIYKLAYQYDLSPSLSLGISPVMYQLTHANIVARGHNLDLGIIYHPSTFYISILAQNSLTHRQVQYRQPGQQHRYETLPFQLHLSSKFSLRHSLDFLAQLSLMHQHRLPSFGLIYRPLPFIQFRLGTSRELNLALRATQRHCIGTRIQLLGLTLAYTYQVNDFTLDPNQHLFSIHYHY